MDSNTPLGPNVKALLVERWSQLMVERSGNTGGPFGKTTAVIARMAEDSGAHLKADMREAFEWVKSVIAAVRAAPDNTLTSDEEIAKEIMRQVHLRKVVRRAS